MAEASNITKIQPGKFHVSDKLAEIASMACVAETMVEIAIGRDSSLVTGRRDMHFVTEQHADATMWAVLALTNKISELQKLLDEQDAAQDEVDVKQAA